MKETEVILVDNLDRETGKTEKMEAHKKALLHRAVSVFICNSKGEWLLQQRTYDKYHSKGLWTNTCCSHPYPGETSMEAAKRRLMEEMGLTADLKELFSFLYKEKLENELTEHEFDHVFYGISDHLPELHPQEAIAYRYISYSDLKKEIEKNPEQYTVWFKLICEKVATIIEKQ